MDYSSSELSREPSDFDELPPVQPPSAGFIVQLFVVPALIVLAIVGVWALFGRMAAGDQDWRRLVVDLQSPNKHIRDRGMFGLAQLLDADRRLAERGQQLATNPEIGRALATQLDTELGRVGHSDGERKEIVTSQVFLVRTLGLLDQPELVFPPLREALEPQIDREVRKGAVMSIALIAGRAAERGQPLKSDDVVQDLVRLSADPDPLMRQTAAFTLGLFEHAEAEQRLLVLLENDDAKTRVNAAIALARHDSTAGYPVFRDILQDAAQAPAEELSREVEFEEFVILKNALRAVGDLADEFEPAQRDELIPLVQPIAANYREPQVRVAAQGTLATLTELNRR